MEGRRSRHGITKNKAIISYKEVNVASVHSVYYALNKPKGVWTDLKVQGDKPTVCDFLPGDKNNIIPVGVLDSQAEGLVFLTSDSHFLNHVLDAGSKVEHIYEAVLSRPLKFNEVALIQKGFSREGIKLYPSEVLKQKETRTSFCVTFKIYEGPHTNFKTVLEGFGLEVLGLQSLSIGPVKLGMLPLGRLRPLTSREILFFMPNIPSYSNQ